MAAETFTKSGSKATTPVKLNSKIFGLKVENHQLLKEAYLAYLANKRPNLAKTKKRGEVRGGGAKPWRQKGTGRARTGSIRSPIWAGGGVTFGPTGEETYTRKITQRSKQLALRQALSLATGANRVKIIDSLNFSEGKVKPVLQLLSKIKAEGKTLFVVELIDDNTQRATRNLRDVNVVNSLYLSVFEILNADTIVITKPALAKIELWLGGSDA